MTDLAWIAVGLLGIGFLFTSVFTYVICKSRRWERWFKGGRDNGP